MARHRSAWWSYLRFPYRSRAPEESCETVVGAQIEKRGRASFLFAVKTIPVSDNVTVVYPVLLGDTSIGMVITKLLMTVSAEGMGDKLRDATRLAHPQPN
jgi:hypothetical protein